MDLGVRCKQVSNERIASCGLFWGGFFLVFFGGFFFLFFSFFFIRDEPCR